MLRVLLEYSGLDNILKPESISNLIWLGIHGMFKMSKLVTTSFEYPFFAFVGVLVLYPVLQDIIAAIQHKL